MLPAVTREVLIEALNGTTVPENQKQAGEFLDKCTKQPTFLCHLLQVAVDTSLSGAVTQAAVIYFKNTVVKYWELDEDEKERADAFELSADDKATVRQSLIHAVCIAPDSVKTQLCVAAQTILRTEFSAGLWPNLLQDLVSSMTGGDAAGLHGSLLIVYRLAKIHEYKRGTERQNMKALMVQVLPLMQHHLTLLMSNEAQESVTIQKLILKIVYSLIQFSLDLDMINVDSMDMWLESAKQIVARGVPAELDSIEDPDEKAQMVWWKCKKWAAKLLDRVFERFGAPGQVDTTYQEFATHFLEKFGVPCVELFLGVLNNQRQNVFVSHRVLFLSLSFISTAAAHSLSWKTIKPHCQELIKTVIFPLLCHSDEDEEMWEDDAEEYVRMKYDLWEDLQNPAMKASELLTALVKRKDVMPPVLAFCIESLAQSQDPRVVDGALRMLGTLSQNLTRSKKYKKDVEKLLDARVIGRLSDPSRFVRARAAWALKMFQDTTFATPKIFRKVIDGLVRMLCNQQEELPALVEAAIAIQCYLDQHEKTPELLKPQICDVITRVLELVSKTQVEDVVEVMDTLLENFIDDCIPIAEQVSNNLANLFLQVVNSDVADDRTPAMMSVISTLGSILEVVSDHREIMVKVEVHVLRIVESVFVTGNVDYYDEVLLLIQELIVVYVSEPLWRVFDHLYKVFTDTGGNIIEFADIMPVLHLYVKTDTESFLARPERLNAMIDMCKTVLADTEQGDENQLFAGKLLEVIIFQCGDHIKETIPAMLMLALERLTKPFDEGLSELKHMMLMVVLSALIRVPETTISALRQLAPDHPNPLDFVADLLVELSPKIEGVHNRKLTVLGWTLLIQLSPELRPSCIAYEPTKAVTSCITIFKGLSRALKAQAENRKAGYDSDDSEDWSTDEDEGEETTKGKKKNHRKIDDDDVLSDDDDEIDEDNLEYLASINKVRNSESVKVGGAEGDKGDEESEDEELDEMFEEETDTEQYETFLESEDSPDVYVQFKKSMELLKGQDVTTFGQMINSLPAEMQGDLVELDKICDQHILSEKSKQLKEAGGFAFSAEAAVPSTFNFGQ